MIGHSYYYPQLGDRRSLAEAGCRQSGYSLVAASRRRGVGMSVGSDHNEIRVLKGKYVLNLI